MSKVPFGAWLWIALFGAILGASASFVLPDLAARGRAWWAGGGALILLLLAQMQAVRAVLYRIAELVWKVTPKDPF